MGKPLRDLTGQKIYRWTIIDRAEKPENTKQTGAWWNCVCDCGTKRVIYSGTLSLNGKYTSKSCGCRRKEVSSSHMKKMRFEKNGTVDERFFSSFEINMSTECWMWTGSKDKDGYGRMFDNYHPIRAHRFSFEKYKHEIPKNSVVCHKCDNPSCVNPEHLFVGKPVDNVRDMLSKNRDKMVGSKNNKAKLVESDIPVIRKDTRP
ncbi:MAG: hypothetical protein GQ557_01400, partial [Mycoplasmataceae bacterium]|nr:hypothetical protein [Mycoplasmataceae bacterium]